ncbi:MAG: AAA family ATPase [Pirellulales bacterium]|nr:AAA family ATPase [Pirellulales bacterium]
MSHRLETTFREYVRACFAGIWIRSDEHDDALAALAAVCREEAWRFAAWDVDAGLRGADDPAAPNPAPDPLAAVRAVERLAEPSGTGILALVNFHRFLHAPEIVQAVARQVQLGKSRRTFLVVVAPVVDLPRELEKLFVVVEHELPDREQLAAIARAVAAEPDDLPEGDELGAVLDAAAGLTRYEAEGAFALSLVRDERLAAATIGRLKAQQLAQSGLVTVHAGPERFADLGGLAAVKEFCLRALRPTGRPGVSPKGILLLSLPGCGKSALAKGLGAEVGRPTLRLDVGALMGSLVGQSEANCRRAIAIAEATAPCILMIDEIDKGLAGVHSGQADGGVAARMFGTLLSWLADRTSDVFVVATANGVARLPPEFARAERFDGVFFIDLPEREEKDAIWAIHRAALGIAPAEPQPPDDQWTGAEIRACCRLAALLDLPLAAAATHVVPVAVAAAEAVAELRAWASGRCLAADRPGVYRPPPTPTTRRRGIRIDPSVN